LSLDGSIVYRVSVQNADSAAKAYRYRIFKPRGIQAPAILIQLLQGGATAPGLPASLSKGNAMRSLPKSSLLIEFQQNGAGLIADLAILLLFVILLAAH